MPQDSNTHIYCCENKLRINRRLVTNNVICIKVQFLFYCCVFNSKMEPKQKLHYMVKLGNAEMITGFQRLTYEVSN